MHFAVKINSCEVLLGDAAERTEFRVPTLRRVWNPQISTII